MLYQKRVTLPAHDPQITCENRCNHQRHSQKPPKAFHQSIPNIMYYHVAKQTVPTTPNKCLKHSRTVKTNLPAHQVPPFLQIRIEISEDPERNRLYWKCTWSIITSSGDQMTNTQNQISLPCVQILSQSIKPYNKHKLDKIGVLKLYDAGEEY
jgi:hypothetical protein